MCYATSADGVRWDRPKLGLYEVMGTRENNVVVSDDHHDGMGHWESTLTSLADLRGKPVRLRFYLTNARLYSYRITA